MRYQVWGRTSKGSISILRKLRYVPFLAGPGGDGSSTLTALQFKLQLSCDATTLTAKIRTSVDKGPLAVDNQPIYSIS